MKTILITLFIPILINCSSGQHFHYSPLNLDNPATGILGEFEATGSQLIIVYKGLIRVKATEAEVLFYIDTKGAEFLLLAETLKPVHEKTRRSGKAEVTHYRGKQSMIFIDNDKPYIVLIQDPNIEYSDPGFSVLEMKRLKPTEYSTLKIEYENARKQTREWFYKKEP